MKNILFLFIPIAFYSTILQAQYLSNPSFEGPPGISVSPPGWLPFEPNSTPDTEPLYCDYFTASDGDTYLTLVTRGAESTYPNTVENCQSQLLQPLEAGFCYNINIDLASRDDVGHFSFSEGFIPYLSNVNLKIYGSNSDSDKGTLLVETEEITNTDWKTISLTFRTVSDIQYLLLEAGLTTVSTGLGNILVDNLILEKAIVKSTVVMDKTFDESDLPVTLTASESSSYSWSPASGLSCYDCRTPQVNNSTSLTYTCTILNTLGCPENELFILNFLNDPPPSPEFKIPNVFTPNGDGINDYFEIPGLPPYSSLVIFDRSGKQVFESEQYNNDWGGTDMDNNELPEETYWYVLMTPGLSGKHKGFVYIKRGE